jgi:nucleotide-binding universal stress UspA family protein
MFKQILVPLDGSRLAESALPAAVYLADKLEASVILIHVIEKDAPKSIHGERHLNNSKDAEDYLKGIASGSFPKSIHVKYHVHENVVTNVSKSIVEHTGEFNPDLIVMCTHGQGGVRDILYGSIAQKVIGLGKTPLLLIQPVTDNFSPTFRCNSILVPVDGNPEHELGLTAAEEIAKACNSRLHLLMAVPVFGSLSGEWTSSSRFLPGTTTRMLEMVAAGSEEYLQHLKEDLSDPNVKITSETYREDPENAIISSAKNMKADIVVLGTHGKSGMEAFWSGSVTAKICRALKQPILLVPIKRS